MNAAELRMYSPFSIEFVYMTKLRPLADLTDEEIFQIEDAGASGPPTNVFTKVALRLLAVVAVSTALRLLVVGFLTSNQ